MKILTQFVLLQNKWIDKEDNTPQENPTSGNSITCHSFEAYMYKNTSELQKQN